MQTGMNARPSNADIAAELAAMEAGTPPPEAAAKDAPPAEVAADAEADAPPAAEDAAAEEAPEAEPDPATARSLALIAKAEQRQKAQAAAERKSLAEERAAIEAARKEEAARRDSDPDRKAFEEFKALRARAKFAPGAALKALGLTTPEDMELAAREAWYETPAGQAELAKTPGGRERLAAMQRERESRGEVERHGGKFAEMEAKLAALTERLEKQTIEQSDQAKMSEYLDSIEEALTNEHVVISKALTAARAKAADRTAPAAERKEAQATVKTIRNEFRDAAIALYQRDGVEPDPVEVAAEVERVRRAELKRWGYDPTATAGAPPKKPPATGRTVERVGGAPTSPKPKLAGKELVDDIKRAVESGVLDA